MSILTVREVNAYIKNMFDRDKRLLSVFVRGEISNFKRHQSGHCYFILKDNEAVLRAVFFRSRAQFLKFEPYNGLKVVAGGRITVYERDGQYQLYVEQLVPAGVGEIGLAIAQLKEKLAAEGLFAPERKRPLPLLPQKVGLITSPTGAAVRDMITVAKRRCPGVGLYLYPVKVQGDEAPAQIIRALKVFNENKLVDVIIVGRGGGSLEELWAFNNEQLVRAIAASEIPVVSAVGHQTDYTLADFAADQRAATPSQAAEIVVPDVRELGRYVASLRRTLEKYLRDTIAARRIRVRQIRDSRGLGLPRTAVAINRQLVVSLFQRLEMSMKQILAAKQAGFKVASEKLAVLNPLSIMQRGYSIVQLPDGQIVRRAKGLAVGQRLQIILAEGSLEAAVTNIGED